MKKSTGAEKRREVYISDLYAAVKEKENLAPYTSKDKWECISYETAVSSGTLLLSSSESQPPAVTIDPKLNGLYKIYVCLGEICGSFETGGIFSNINIKLSGDEFPSTVSSARMGAYSMWSTTENVEESLWKCADMTGRTIEISKPDVGIKHPSNIFWFHFVPIEDGDAAPMEPKRTMLAHMDGDFHMFDVTVTPRDYCKPIYAMKESDVGIICEEVMNDLCDHSRPGDDYTFRTAVDSVRASYAESLTRDRAAVYREQIEYAHACGIKMFAGHRMQLSNFSLPFENPMFRVAFVDENRDKRCVAPDGTETDFLSYGYKEVRDFMTGALLESARAGFDGALCIWTRGIHLYFEEPVAAKFKKKFGGDIDIRTLPEGDARLAEIKGDIIADFYRGVRRALADEAKKIGREPMKIFITGCFDVMSSKKDGIDVERLAREGLIDGVIQTKMKMCELTDGVTDENGLVDVKKYAEKAKHERMYDRISGSRVDLLAAGAGEYRAIADRYGIDFFTEIQWETYKKPEEYVDGAKQVYSAGAKGISLWDCYPSRVNILSEWAATSRLGDAEKVMKMSADPGDYHKIIKVLSYNGKDVRYISPSWRG